MTTHDRRSFGRKLTKPLRLRPTRSFPSFRLLPRRPAFPSKRETFRLRAGFSRISPSISTPRRSSPTIWPNLASWRKSLKPTSSSCPTSAPRIPQLKAAIKELQAKGLQRPGLSRRREDRCRERDQGALRQGSGQRRQPGPARRQLGPARRGLGQAVCPQTSAQDGRLEPRFENPCRAYDRRRFLRQREIRHRRRGRQLQDRVRRRGRRGHGAEGEDALQGGRSDRCRSHEPPRACARSTRRRFRTPRRRACSCRCISRRR